MPLWQPGHIPSYRFGLATTRFPTLTRVTSRACLFDRPAELVAQGDEESFPGDGMGWGFVGAEMRPEVYS
ncbi:hypothetical protein VTN00DRAFT_3908 [Thermoascus crustaceus]|uniref:uncharacterized protein n=1 Tax=Thermoascus crustaceus TaxID=5088 RepID=UPI00374300AD